MKAILILFTLALLSSCTPSRKYDKTYRIFIGNLYYVDCDSFKFINDHEALIYNDGVKMKVCHKRIVPQSLSH